MKTVGLSSLVWAGNKHHATIYYWWHSFQQRHKWKTEESKDTWRRQVNLVGTTFAWWICMYRWPQAIGKIAFLGSDVDIVMNYGIHYSLTHQCLPAYSTEACSVHKCLDWPVQYYKIIIIMNILCFKFSQIKHQSTTRIAKNKEVSKFNILSMNRYILSTE